MREKMKGGGLRKVALLWIWSWVLCAKVTEGTSVPTFSPSISPTLSPSLSPSTSPTASPSEAPTQSPSTSPTSAPSESPSSSPTSSPSAAPSSAPSSTPTAAPSVSPTLSPTTAPSRTPTTSSPTASPESGAPTGVPSASPSASPSSSPSASPTRTPSAAPSTPLPTSSPSIQPTASPVSQPPPAADDGGVAAALASVTVLAVCAAGAFFIYRRRKSEDGEVHLKWISSSAKYLESVIPSVRGQRGDSGKAPKGVVEAQYSSKATDPAFASLQRGALKRVKTHTSDSGGEGRGQRITLDAIEKGMTSSLRKLRPQNELDESADDFLNGSEEKEGKAEEGGENGVTEEEMHSILAPSKAYEATNSTRARGERSSSLLGKYFRSSRKKSKKKKEETEIRSVRPLSNYIPKRKKKAMEDALKDLEGFDV